MSNKTKLGIFVASILVSFACGRYTVQAPEVKTTETVQQDVKKDVDKDTNTHQVEVKVQKPDGTVQTTITTDTSTTAKVDTNVTTNTQIKQDVIPPKTNTLNVSVLAGLDFARQTPVYGASVSKQLLGPITIGAFGLTNGIIGGSIGLNF